jgi:hypothetical protein
MHKRKLSVGSVIGTIILGGLMIALMIYTATRTVHFLQMTFPSSMAYVAYLALAAFDGGIIGWTIFATSTAEGALQRGVAYLMIFVDTLGVILTTIADTTTVSAQNGLTKVDPYMATVGMWGSIAIIVLNVVAIIVTHLVAPHHVRKFELENVHDSIHQLTMQHIRDRSLEIAPRIAAEHADHWVRQTIQDVVGSLPASSQTRQIPEARVVESPRLAPAKAAHIRQKVDPHKVRRQVDSEKKSIEEKESLLDKFHGGIEKVFFKRNSGSNVADGELEPPVDYEEEEEEEIEEETEELEAVQPEPEQDLMELPIDQRWQEYTSLNAETPTPKKGRGGKKAKKAVDQAD